MAILLEINHLQVVRGSQKILHVEHLSVNERETLAIVGPNGAGKSSLILSIAYLLKPNTGEIIFQGKRILPPMELSYRRQIALVMQDALLLDRSVFDNVASGLYYRNISKKETVPLVEKWLDILGILSLSNRAAHSLSGGEAQRVSLARAFVLNPDLLLLDEPFSSLDAPTRLHLLSDIQSILTSSAITTIFITHDLNEALMLGTRLVVMMNGQIRQNGFPQEVLSSPNDAEVAAFVGVESIIPAKVSHSQDGIITVQVGQVSLEAVAEIPKGRDVYLCLRPEDITLWDVGKIQSSSARNQINGIVLKVIPQGALMRVELDCGFRLIALITRASAQEMEIKEGKTVIASFKASAIHIIPH